jgi:hypothetical protein
MSVIRVRDVPSHETIFSFIRRLTDVDRITRTMKPRIGDLARLELACVGLDLEAVRRACLEALTTYGLHGWRHREGTSRSYGGFSLTYNPDHQDDLDPHASTLGTPRNPRDRFYWRSLENHTVLKHSYFDTYGFRRRTAASRIGALGELLDGCAASLVRSRVGLIDGTQVDPDDPQYRAREGWHRDEPVFENLRINVPLQSDPNYVFEMAGEVPYHLEVGRAYSWDTHKPHRVFCAGRTTATRIHLVLGFAPWFDFVEEDDGWRPNEYFGRVHPLDMAAEGLIAPAFRLAAAVPARVAPSEIVEVVA